jgi:hypothetical protein
MEKRNMKEYVASRSALIAAKLPGYFHMQTPIFSMMGNS